MEIDFVNDDSNFNETGFKEALPGLLGLESLNRDDGSKIKTFDNMKNLGDVFKFAQSTKSAFDKKTSDHIAGLDADGIKALVGDRVIHRPAEGADDAAKLTFRKGLLSELGAPDDAASYIFNRPELPDGMTYNEGTEALFRGMFHELNLPADMAMALSDGFNRMQIDNFNAKTKATDEAFSEAFGKHMTDNPGDKAVTTLRHALDAIRAFNPNDDDLIKLIDETKLNDNLTDSKLWRKVGFDDFKDIAGYATIGAKMASGISHKDDSDINKTDKSGDMYDHPTSVEQDKAVKAG